MSDAFIDEFTRFAREKLRPFVDEVQGNRRKWFRFGLCVAVGLFAVFAAAVYFSLAPFREILKDTKVSVWPLMILAPLAMGMVGFSVVYILGLRNVVKQFREALVGKLAEFIDPALVHEAGRPLPAEAFDASLLFGQLARPVAGEDHFRGRSGEAVVEFGDVSISPAGDKKALGLGGPFFTARYEKRFRTPFFAFPTSLDISRSGLEEGVRGRGFSVGDGLVRLDDPSAGRQVLLP